MGGKRDRKWVGIQGKLGRKRNGQQLWCGLGDENRIPGSGPALQFGDGAAKTLALFAVGPGLILDVTFGSLRTQGVASECRSRKQAGLRTPTTSS